MHAFNLAVDCGLIDVAEELLKYGTDINCKISIYFCINILIIYI